MAFICDRRTCRGPNLSLTDMALTWTLLALFIFVDISRTYAQEVCPERDVEAAGRRCERACSADGTCRKQNRECACDGLCGLSCLRRSAGEVCERNEEEISRLGRRCMRPCDSNDDCLGNRECVCDDICGMSCIPTGREEYCPRLQERGANFTLAIEPSSRAFGSIATYSCRRNFERVRGDAQMKCLGVGEWSGNPSVCLHRHRCEPPPEIENARPVVIKDYYDHEEQVAFSCSPGFARVGGIRAVLTCYRNTWTEPLFQCRRKSCGDPGFLLNGRKIGTSFLFRDTVRYECDVGYRLIGAEERFCQSNQEWTRVTPTCEVVRCPTVTHPNNGRRIGYEFEYDRELDFRCNTGYILEGNHEIRCQANGTWSWPVPTCREIRCPAPSVPEHGSSDADRSEYAYGDTVTFSCADDYELRGSNEVTCSSNENWLPLPPICQATCTVPTPPHYGGWQNRAREGQRVLEGHELEYYCHRTHFKCQVFPLRCVNGSWTPPASHLCLRSCPMENAQTVGLTISYSHPDGISCTHQNLKPVGTIRSFTCLRGYRIPVGVSHRSTCDRRNYNQRWSSSLPTCEKILCPRIYLSNGDVRYTLSGTFTSTLEQNTTASFLCHRGYDKSHPNSSSCDIGQWTNEKPDCIEQPCSESSIVVGNWDVGYDTPAPESSPEYRRPGTVASFNCIEYGYSTSIQHTCRRGQWEGQRPICQRIPCTDQLLNNGNLIYTPDRIAHGTVRTYQCNQGFTLRGIDSSYCDAGRWTNDLPECIEDPCRENDIDGGRWERDFNSPANEPGFRPPGTVVVLRCPRGYETFGTKTCQAGTWTGSRLSCEIIRCQEEGLVHGRVLYEPPRPEHGTFRTFECHRGYHFLDHPGESLCDEGEWTTELPSCVEDPCRETEIVDDQWRIAYNRGPQQAGMRPHGTVASFHCTEHGHVTSDTKECRTGQWTGPPVVCNKIPCESPGNVLNGDITYSTNRLEQGTIVWVTCHRGYQLSQIRQVLCDLGRWTPEIPSCEEKPCEETEIVDDQWRITYDRGPQQAGMRPHGTVANFQCTEHGHVTSDTKECRTGRWRGPPVVCNKIPCESPGNVLNGDITYSTNRLEQGTILWVTCHGGYQLSQLGEASCDLGRWTPEIPSCEEKSCDEGSLRNEEWNVTITYESDRSPGDNMKPPGTVTTLACDSYGYLAVPIRGQHKTCSRGEWIGDQLLCDRVNCPLENYSNVQFIYYNARNQSIYGQPKHNDTRIAQCQDGSNFTGGSRVSNCTNGTWSGEIPQCTEDPCRQLEDLPRFLRVSYNLPGVQYTNTSIFYPHQTIATFACVHEGFVIEGDAETRCRRGRWRNLNDYPNCTRASCPYETPQHGRITYWNGTEVTATLFHGDVVTIHCDNGYRRSDNSFRAARCENAIFNQDLPACEEEYCPALASEDYSFIIYNGTSSAATEFSAWTRVEVECRQGMYPRIDGPVICRLGQWTPGIPTCSESAPCPAIDDVPGRTIFYGNDPPYTHGSNLTVICEPEDTRLIGSEESTCMAGRWIPVVGDCFSNVARDKTAYQKSRPYNDREASKATDGVSTTGTETCSFSHHRLQDPWWFVDLGNTYTVEQILIYRPLGYRNRLLNSVIRVGQERGTRLGQNTMVGEIIDLNSNPIIIHVNGSVKGRFVSVEDPGYSYDALALCEVEVFGKLAGDECESGCVVPRPLYNGYYSSHHDGTTSIESGSCFVGDYLYIVCNERNRQGLHVYFCNANTGALAPPRNYIYEWSRCGLNCPRPQVNPNVVYHVGNDPVNDRTFFRPGEVITSRCEDPTFQLHDGSVNMRCEANGEWSHTAPRCLTSKLRMDVASASSVTKSSNGSFVLRTTTDEVTVNCAMNQNNEILENDSRLLKDEIILSPIEKSAEDSVVGFTIQNATTADSGVYRCISGELTHSIRILFEDPPPCRRPTTNHSSIAIIELSGSRVTPDRQTYNEGDALTFVCENDRVHQRIHGPQQVQCRNGEWILVGTNDRMENAPTCATTGCRRPHINPSVVVHVGEEGIPIGSRQFFTEGEIITSRCDDPRPKHLIGPVRRRCTHEGWTETAPRCEDSQLRMGVDNTRLFDFLPNGTFVVFPISGQVWINCKKLSGSPFASSATISTNSSARRRIVRRTPTLRRLVVYDPTPASSGNYTCRNTNSLSRSINIRFQDIRCAEPGPVSNGQWEHIKATANRFIPTSYIFKETVRLDCSDGYKVNGTSESQCNYHGRWSPPLASCVAN